jgi:AcrR family transcriptional regulator
MSIRRTEKTRVRRSPEASRENILSAAEALLTAKGPQALKLADVAAEAGVANATVLHHFGSIDGVEAALMDRMIAQLAASVLDAREQESDPATAREVATRKLFDAFETRGAARLAAWLVLTDQTSRLTMVRQAVQAVVATRIRPAGISADEAEDLVLLSVLTAVGAGLFGRPLAALLGKPEGRARELALEVLLERKAVFEG